MQQIERLRKARGWSRYRLARELGVTEKAVAKWERDGIARAQYALMRRMARTLGVPMEDLDSGGEWAMSDKGSARAARGEAG